MKKHLLLLLLIIGFSCCSWSQPDYSEITFRTKLKEYKKKQPNLKGLGIDRALIKDIVSQIGSSFYSENEIDDITEKTWLAFNDPKKFDYVYKDLGIRTIPNWNKKNVRGLIVVEPHPFLKEWTLADNELEYIQEAFSRILIYYQLMGYGEDAKNTRKSLKKLLFTKKMLFPGPSSADWTNSYLFKVNYAVQKKGLVSIVANGGYGFVVCQLDKRDELVSLFSKLDWTFIDPQK